MQYANELLSQSVYLLTSAYNLIDKYKFKDILDNIVLLGLPKKQDEVLYLERKNNYEKTHSSTLLICYIFVI